MGKRKNLARKTSKMKPKDPRTSFTRQLAISQANKDIDGTFVGKRNGKNFYRAKSGRSSSGSFFSGEELFKAKKRSMLVSK